MRLFFRIIKLAILQQTTYRAALAAGLATNFVWGLLRAAVIVGLYGSQTSVNGVLLRDGDGVHIVPTATAGAWLAARILPPATSMGRARIAGRPLDAPGPGVASPPVTASASGVPRQYHGG